MEAVGGPIGDDPPAPTRVRGARYPFLDGIRIIAAVAVIVSHSYALLGRPEPEPASFGTYRLTLGAVAVGVFFVVSGFLITASWRASSGLWAYSVKRVFRIWPALILAVLGAAYVVGPLVTTLPVREYLRAPGTSAYVKNNITMIPITNTLPGVFTSLPVPAVNGSLWTLPYEVLCYIGAAAAGMLGLLRYRWVVLGLAIASLAWCEWVFRDPTGWWSFVPHIGLIALLVVVLVPWFCVGAALRSWHDSIPAGPVPGIVAAAILALGVVTSRPSPIIVGLGFLVIWIGTKPIPWHLPRWAGDPSYGMYVFAFPAQQCLIYTGLAMASIPLLILEATVLSFAAGVVSWHGLERPMITFGGRLAAAPKRAIHHARALRARRSGPDAVERSPGEEPEAALVAAPDPEPPPPDPLAPDPDPVPLDDAN
jgi:peptidoglycan/LPS O-acetylase OafA/YrhL